MACPRVKPEERRGLDTRPPSGPARHRLISDKNAVRGEAKLIVRNGMVAFPGQDEFLVRDIRIEQGRVAEIGTGLASSSTASSRTDIDANGCWVLPGGIDPHVHFYDPGYTDKEDFAHGTSFSAQGGITTIIDMPCTSDPPVSDLFNLEAKLSVVAPKAVVDFGFFGGASRQCYDAPDYPGRLAEMADKVMGIKSYAVSGMDDEWGALDSWRFLGLLRLCAEHRIPALLHAEDRSFVDAATAAKQAAGLHSPKDWYEARPEIAEVLSVMSAIRLAAEAGAQLHIVHVGTAEAAELLGRAPDSVSGETCPQYLAFNLEDFQRQGAALKIAPPIKTTPNPQGLWEHLTSDSLKFVASDHAPGTSEEKSGHDIWCQSAGISGTGTMLPFIFSEGYLAGRLSLSRYLQVMSENAPRRYGFFDRKGSIEVGKDADLVLMDSRKDWTVHASEFLSKGRLSPFEGRVFRGRVERTLVRGETVYQYGKGILVDGGYGKFIRPNRRSSQQDGN